MTLFYLGRFFYLICVSFILIYSISKNVSFWGFFVQLYFNHNTLETY